MQTRNETSGRGAAVLLGFLRVLTRLVYRVRVMGAGNLPAGGALLVCNHVTYVDALVLLAASPRPVRFIAYEAFYKKWWLGWAFRLLGVIPISPRHAKDAIQRACARMSEGELVCVFPEGELTRTGTVLTIHKGFEMMARRAGVPVVPVFLGSLWGSIFSYADRRFFWKWPRRLPYAVTVSFGLPIPAAEATSARVRQQLLDEGERAFQLRPDLQRHVAELAVRALANRPWRTLVVDFFPARHALSRGVVLALAIVLARRWRRRMPGRRIGIVLPPGIGGTLANLGVLLADKIPVNLNFTMGTAAAASCLSQGGVEPVLSAPALQAKCKEFPWPAQTVDIAAEIEGCDKRAILGWLVLIYLLPSSWLVRLLGVPRRGDRAEAALLFTSGSSGAPKGVPLTHRNIISNVLQVAEVDIVGTGDVVLSCLPLFHSFGFTTNLWFPILHGNRFVTVPSPLDTRRTAEAIQQEQAVILMSAPTFLRPFLKRVEPEQLRSLRGIMAGAEKVPPELVQAFQDRFGVPIYEGYGLTETSPVTSVNLPDPPIPTGTAGPQQGSRPGSVGRLMPGMAARIVAPEGGAPLTLFETGLLLLRGPNVFEGYLDNPAKTAAVLQDGWFQTGDLARFDEDGFLFIEGRLSRFSKIGGEMVPHGTVEQMIVEAFQLSAEEGQPVAVVGVADPVKGEGLVLLTTVAITAEALHTALAAAGASNLWVPRVIRQVPKIPVLATGKVDQQACRQLAGSFRAGM
jgi:acyl-[acyl-carrier-protein]-phospholipid O-acyltransferase/long-chain-fatty-acid--[acyl-carrier-protein] ligase